MASAMNNITANYGVLWSAAAKDVIKKQSGRVPDKQAVVNSDAAVVFSHIEDHRLIFVFDDGYVLYQTDLINDMVRSTVFPLKDATFYYNFVNDDKQVIDEKTVANLPSELVLHHVGDQRIYENVCRNLKENNMDDVHGQWEKEFCSSPDILEKMVDRAEIAVKKQILFSSVKNLSKLQLSVLYYRFCLGYTQLETAEKLNVKRPKVQYQEREALKKLRDEFIKRGFDIKK